MAKEIVWYCKIYDPDYQRVSGRSTVLAFLAYTKGMLDATEPKIIERIKKLRAELAEISRLNEEYRHISHTIAMKEAHSSRRNRLEQIVLELKTLGGA